MERNNAGFHLFKAKLTDVSQVTPELIPAKGTLPDGTEYSYVDKNIAPGIYVYVLVDIDTNGKSTYLLIIFKFPYLNNDKYRVIQHSIR